MRVRICHCTDCRQERNYQEPAGKPQPCLFSNRLDTSKPPEHRAVVRWHPLIAGNRGNLTLSSTFPSRERAVSTGRDRDGEHIGFSGFSMWATKCQASVPPSGYASPTGLTSRRV
jgi:hypothetical protein